MKKKLSLIWAAAIGIVLVIGSVVATLVISPLLTAGTNSNAAANGNAANGSSASGAVVIAWNKELLHIVLTPGDDDGARGTGAVCCVAVRSGIAVSAGRQ